MIIRFLTYLRKHDYILIILPSYHINIIVCLLDDVIITYRDILSLWLVFMMDKQNNNKNKTTFQHIATKQYVIKQNGNVFFYDTLPRLYIRKCCVLVFYNAKSKTINRYILINNGRLPTHLKTLVIYKYQIHCKR